MPVVKEGLNYLIRNMPRITTALCILVCFSVWFPLIQNVLLLHLLWRFSHGFLSQQQNSIRNSLDSVCTDVKLCLSDPIIIYIGPDPENPYSHKYFPRKYSTNVTERTTAVNLNLQRQGSSHNSACKNFPWYIWVLWLILSFGCLYFFTYYNELHVCIMHYAHSFKNTLK